MCAGLDDCHSRKDAWHKKGCSGGHKPHEIEEKYPSIVLELVHGVSAIWRFFVLLKKWIYVDEEVHAPSEGKTGDYNHEKFEASAILNLQPLRAAIHTQETDNSSRH